MLRLFLIVLMLSTAVARQGGASVFDTVQAQTGTISSNTSGPGSIEVIPASGQLGPQSRKTQDFIFRLAVVALLLTIGIGLFLGLTDRAIFYLNGRDFFFSFMPVGGMFIVFLIVGFLFEAKGDWVGQLAASVAVVLGLVVLYRSYAINNMNIWVGVTVGVAKIALGLFALFQLLQILAPSGKTPGQKRASQAMALVIFAMASGLIYKLINGERVLATRREMA